MPRTWQTDEVIRHLAEVDQDEIQDLLEEAGMKQGSIAGMGMGRKRTKEPL